MVSKVDSDKDALLEKLPTFEDILESQAAQIKILREALEYYGDKENWCSEDGSNGEYQYSLKFEDEELSGSCKIAGMKARQALAEIDKMNKVVP